MSCALCWESDWKGETVEYCNLNIHGKCNGENKDCKNYKEAIFNEPIVKRIVNEN
jgi:hypothetical protein